MLKDLKLGHNGEQKIKSRWFNNALPYVPWDWHKLSTLKYIKFYISCRESFWNKKSLKFCLHTCIFNVPVMLNTYIHLKHSKLILNDRSQNHVYISTMHKLYMYYYSITNCFLPIAIYNTCTHAYIMQLEWYLFPRIAIQITLSA